MAYGGNEFRHKRLGDLDTYCGLFACDPDVKHSDGVAQEAWVEELSSGLKNLVTCPECLKTKEPSKPKRGRPKGSKNKPKEISDDDGPCTNCGEVWGAHYGVKCPNNGNTTWKFSKKKKQSETPQDPDRPDVYVKLTPEMCQVLVHIGACISGPPIEGYPRHVVNQLTSLLEQEGYCWRGQDQKYHDRLCKGSITFDTLLGDRSTWPKAT